MAKANVTLVEAQMGEGKTNTATAVVIDDYFAHVTAIKSPSGVVLPVEPYRLDTVRLLPLLPRPPEVEMITSGKKPKETPFGGRKTKSVLAKLATTLPPLVTHLPGGYTRTEESRLITIPPDYEAISDTKIFANYHLYGIRYVLSDPMTMLEYLNTGLISHGKMIIDEAYITGEARRGMNSLSLIYTWFAQQMRKRDIELYLLVQHGRFIDWRFRYIAKRKILCRYNEKTHMIKLLVQNLSKGTEKMLSFYAPHYWKYFDTNELPPVPEKMLMKAAPWA